MKRIVFLVLASLATVLLASCSSSGATKAASTPAASHGGGITISNFAYGGQLTVKPGQKVTVTNNDSVAHTVTDKKTHLFDTGNVDGNGGTGTFTAPTKPGTYSFGCTYHPQMAGTLTVKN